MHERRSAELQARCRLTIHQGFQSLNGRILFGAPQQNARALTHHSNPQEISEYKAVQWENATGAKLNDRGGDRTHDLRIKSPLLYRLSYPVNLLHDNHLRVVRCALPQTGVRLCVRL